MSRAMEDRKPFWTDARARMAWIALGGMMAGWVVGYLHEGGSLSFARWFWYRGDIVLTTEALMWGVFGACFALVADRIFGAKK